MASKQVTIHVNDGFFVVKEFAVTEHGSIELATHDKVSLYDLKYLALDIFDEELRATR